MENLKLRLTPETGEKTMTLKFVSFAAGLFAMTLLSLSLPSPASAVDYNKDDLNLQRPIDQGETLEAGDVAACPTGTCVRNLAPGSHPDGQLIEPAGTEAPAIPATSTKTKK